ncbi:MAG TPA: hypothetical protein VKU00_31140 [Chthonomonadaceae bacterium]|nr:hypothetical protein [Chthonomonadaceae bacterium]
MNVSRLTVMHINIIGAVAALILGVALFFILIKPKNDDIAKTKADWAASESQGGTDSAVKTAQSGLVTAKKDTERIKKQWAVDEKYYMPELKFDKDLLAMYESRGYQPPRGPQIGFKDLPAYWGKWITGWYDSQVNQGVVRTPDTVFPIEGFPADPNYLATLTSITFPRGKPWNVTLECKSFADAMNHLRRFNRMQNMGVPVINNVALSGQSPQLTLSYELALYIIPSEAPPAKDPRIGAGAGGGAGGGMGGMMGGPGGMGGKFSGMSMGGPGSGGK